MKDLMAQLLRQQAIVACDRFYKRPHPGRKHLVKFPRKLEPRPRPRQGWDPGAPPTLLLRNSGLGLAGACVLDLRCAGHGAAIPDMLSCWQAPSGTATGGVPRAHINTALLSLRRARACPAHSARPTDSNRTPLWRSAEAFYVWIEDRPMPPWQIALAVLLAVTVLALCLFPLAPAWARSGAVYLFLGLLGGIFALIALRFFLFLIVFTFIGALAWGCIDGCAPNCRSSRLFLVSFSREMCVRGGSVQWCVLVLLRGCAMACD